LTERVNGCSNGFAADADDPHRNLSLFFSQDATKVAKVAA
jgi:hypothetical protein